MGKHALWDRAAARGRQRRLRSVALLLAAVGPLVAATGCKRSQGPSGATAASPSAPAAQPAAKAPPSASPVAAAPVAAPPAGPVVTLTYVGARDLPGLPSFFEPTGRFVGLPEKGENDEKDSCRLWSLATLTYVGPVPLERCEEWPRKTCFELPSVAFLRSNDKADKYRCDHLPGERTLTTTDRKTVVRWQDAALAIERDGSVNKITAGCEKKGDCAKVIAVALSPDDKQLALARRLGNRIYVVDLATGKTEKTLKLDKNELALPDLLGWGEHGLTALVGTRANTSDDAEAKPAEPSAEPAEPAAAATPSTSGGPPPEDDPQHPDWVNDVQLMLWKTPAAKGKKTGFSASFDISMGGSVTMDPHGRYLYLMRDGRRSSSTLAIFDAAKNKEASLITMDDGGEEETCGGTELSEPKWIPGTWPILETIETANAECTASYSAWRLYTAPGQRRVTQSDLRKAPDKKAVRVVKEDGVGIATLSGKEKQAAGPMPEGRVDPGKRWEATGKDSIKRLSDGEELIFVEKGCVRTARWVFDCPLDRFAQHAFLLDPDPLKGELVRGAQVAHLYHRPGLAEAFFEGKDVAPLPAVKTGVGRAPRLESQGVKYLEGEGPNFEITLLAHDGGDGVSGVKVWFEKGSGPHLPAAPLALVAETPTPVQLTLPTTTCDQLQIVACNRDDRLCSPPVTAPFCPKKKHKLPKKSSG